MFKKLILAVLALGLIAIYNSCSSSSGSGGTETNNAAVGSGAAVTAVFGSMSGEASINERARIPQSIINLLVKKAIAQGNFTACDAVNETSGPEGIEMSLDGEDGDYGNPADLFTVQDGGTYEFCADDGDVAAWEITDAVSVDCTQGDESFAISMTGSGIFREDNEANQTVIGGDFIMTSGDDSVESPCSFQINHDNGAFEGEGCAGDGLDPSDDVECEDPGSGDNDSNSEEDSDSEGEGGAPTCETADDCQDFTTTEESCVDGFCNFSCETDDDCNELESAGESISCTEGSCIPDM